jgi:hypothetical protein
MSDHLMNVLAAKETAPAFPAGQAEAVALDLSGACSLAVYPKSITAGKESIFFLGRRGDEKLLGIVRRSPVPPQGFSGTTSSITCDGTPLFLTLCPQTPAVAAALRVSFPFLAPRPLGLRRSVGCGDRLGLATPGHVRAVRRSGMAPIFAQQSMRENARTGRNPQQVVDDALWGVFQEGWRDGYGADADHLKSAADIDLCAAAGYTFYTFDPGEHVVNQADGAPISALQHMSGTLPWSSLDTSADDLRARLVDRPIDLGSFDLTISWVDLLRAAVKYGRAVSHTASLYRHLSGVMGSRPHELEMSIDETESVTTLAEHVYIAHELKRLGVHWISLAPRYVGTFEKGVDYIGDPLEFEQSFARHMAVARTYGPYKLSLHSGSDKFSIYPIASRLAGDLVHLKTAGTSYLEAVRAVSVLDPGLFRKIVALARKRYPQDRASYHVSARVGRMPDETNLKDSELAAVLDDFHGREVLHVTFGSILKDENLKGHFYAALRGNEEVYFRMLEQHFDRHLLPFSG